MSAHKRLKTVALTPAQVTGLVGGGGFDQRHAALLTMPQMVQLATWCDCQHSALWDDMTVQEILNVYRISWEWDTWEGWAEDDRPAAHAAWNRAVIDPGNKMVPQP